MKQRFFMLMATVLLMSTSVFAQNSENWDGDVNKDGVVDVADINAIIYLMKEAAGEYDGKTYYWYVGTSKPTVVNGTVVNAETDVWTPIGTTKPNQIYIESPEDYSFPKWYVAIPTEFNFQPYDMTGSELDLVGWENQQDTTTLAGYTIWISANNDASFISMFK